MNYSKDSIITLNETETEITWIGYNHLMYQTNKEKEWTYEITGIRYVSYMNKYMPLFIPSWKNI